MSRAFSALKWKISGFRKAQSLRTRARSRRQAAGAVPAPLVYTRFVLLIP